LGDDPTVIELEKLAAEMAGKEAALFVPSGTMGNQICIATHTKPGDAMLVEEEAHVLYYEVGAPAVLNGVVTWTLPSNRGAMDPDVIRKRVLKANLHTPGTVLLCLENTHNRAGGAVIPQQLMKEYRKIGDETGMALHLDGARVFNAAVAQGLPIRDICQYVDTASLCLSKGLCSPVGSVIVGPRAFIDRALIWRKRLGGGMRQAGILAACGLVSLRTMIDRLADDHRRAKHLASSVQDLPGLHVNPIEIETNLVLISTDKAAEEWTLALSEMGVSCFPVASNRFRLVFHADVDDVQADHAIEAIKQASLRLA
jgi:threonine aldolase